MTLSARSSAVRAGLAYAVAVGGLFLAELLLSRSQNETTFGEYQIVRQLVPLVVALALMGIDQALMRRTIETGDDGLFRPYVRRSFAAAAAIGAVGAAVVATVYHVSAITIVAAALAPLFVVSTELAAAVLRAHGSYVAAAMLQQGYRLLTAFSLVVVVLMGSVSTSVANGALLASSVTCGIVALPVLARTANTGARRDRELHRVGVGFGVSMLTFAALDWADQALLSHRFYTLAAGGAYAANKLVTVYPAITLASVLGFVALPELVRRASSMTRARFLRMLAAAGVVSIVLAVILGSLLHWSGTMFVRTQPNPLAVYLLALTGALRLAYVVPSAVLGSTGTSRTILRSAFLGLLAIPLLAVLLLVLPIDDPVLLGSVAILSATAFRFAVATWFAAQSIGQAAVAGGATRPSSVFPPHETPVAHIVAPYSAPIRRRPTPTTSCPSRASTPRRRRHGATGTTPDPAVIRTIFASVLTVVGTTVLVLTTPREASSTPDSTAWILCVLTIPWVFLALRSLAGRWPESFWLSPSGMAMVYLWVSVLVVPVLWRVGLATPWDDFNAQPDDVIWIAIGLLAVMTAVSAAAMAGRKPARITFRAPSPSALTVPLLIAFAAGLVAMAVLYLAVGGFGALLSSLGTRRDALAGLGLLNGVAAVPGAAALFAMMCERVTPFQKLLALGCALEFILYLFVSGSRFPLIAFLLALLVARAHHRPISLASFGLLGALAVPFSVWYAVAVRQTSKGATGSSVFGGEGLRDVLKSVIDPFVFGGLDVLRTLGAVIAHGEPLFANGILQFLGGPFTLVPRFIWPGKPDGLSIAFSQEYFPDRWADGTGVPPSLLAEGPYLFGKLGAIPYLAAAAFVLAWAGKRVWQSSSAFTRLAGIMLTTDTIVLVKSGSDSFLRMLTLHALACAFFALLARIAGFIGTTKPMENHDEDPVNRSVALRALDKDAKARRASGGRRRHLRGDHTVSGRTRGHRRESK